MTVELQELDEIRSLAHDFALAELRPNVERWDHERATDPALAAQLAELGFLGMTVPERFGGMELSLAAVSAILLELAWGEPSVALTLALHSRAALLVLEHGTEDQRAAWLDALASGSASACLALAEEDAGSDLENVVTTARRSGDGFVLNGTKRWVSNGSTASVALVLAKMEDGAGGLFFVALDAAGVSVGARDDMMGLRPMPIVSLELMDCQVGTDALLGGTSEAREQLAATASFERLAIASIAAGIARAALEHAIGYAAEREQFGQPLRAFEGIQFKLADMATRTAAAHALLRAAAGSADVQQTQMAKLYATEAAMYVTTQAVQIYGGYGYMRDYPVEKLMRDAKAMEILGGANELLRVAVAAALYRD
ncbi:MAG: acyl-CoA dehydrogenase family protein [Longimicrobiales bacterium]